jgi:hypothetical protein
MKKNMFFLYSLCLLISLYLGYRSLKVIFHVNINSSIYYWTEIGIISLFLLGYLTYSWRYNIFGLLNRSYAAVSLALIFSLLIKLIGLNNRMVVTILLFMFIFLVFKTPNWKQHFLIILILFSLFVITFKFLSMLLNEQKKDSTDLLLRIFFETATMFILNYFILYFDNLINCRPVDLKRIFIKSLKFNVAVCLFIVAFYMLNSFGDKQGLSFPAQLACISLLSILFLAVGYKYDLFPFELKKKNNRRDEIQKELMDFYIERKAKIKNK